MDGNLRSLGSDAEQHVVDPNRAPQSGPQRVRFLALDQVRGLAICAMVLAHFGPGVYERIGLTGPLLDVLKIAGRFATPAFITIFGITLAFAYLPKAKSNYSEVSRKLRRRSFTVFLCAVLVSVPDIIEKLNTDGISSLVFDIPGYIFALYGVLIFYTVAIFLCSYLILPLSSSPYIAPFVVGSVLIFIGTALGFSTEIMDNKFFEFIRLVLVSGKYGVFTSLGVALLLIPIGTFIRQQLQCGLQYRPQVLLISLSVMLICLAIGVSGGLSSVEQMHSSFSSPPYVWYLGIIASVAMICLIVLSKFKVGLVSSILGATGRNPMKIYVAHSFVLPAVAFVEEKIVAVPELLRIALPLGAFLIYWFVLVIRDNEVIADVTKYRSIFSGNKPDIISAR